MASKKKTSVDMDKVKLRVEKNIHNASEYPLNLAMCVYARPKVGKTRFVSSAPDVLVIDCDEQGTDSVRHDYDPKTIRITSWTEINDIYWYLHSGDHPYRSVAIDTVSGLQTLCLNWILGDEASRDTSRDPDQPSQRIYQKRSKLMGTIITNFRNLPMNVLFTAHTRATETGEGDEEVISVTGPNLAPATATQLLAAVGLIGYMSKREVNVKRKVDGVSQRVKVRKVRMLIGPSERYETGVRYSALKDLDHIDDPTFPDIYKMIAENKALKKRARKGKKTTITKEES